MRAIDGSDAMMIDTEPTDDSVSGEIQPTESWYSHGPGVGGSPFLTEGATPSKRQSGRFPRSDRDPSDSNLSESSANNDAHGQRSLDDLVNRLVPGPYKHQRPSTFQKPVFESPNQVIDYWETTISPDMLSYFDIVILGGNAEGRYMQWDLKPGFFLAAQARPGFIDTISMKGKATQSPVYVEISQGGPTGDYFVKMVADSRRVAGLAVQAYGRYNRGPCLICERRFVEGEADGKAAMWPFFECCSVNTKGAESRVAGIVCIT
ncbi:Uu.00g004550.m01.CDS01 [Anthostomella pinea]|uniref:Uu.00g004550.m01.CDS01 n=1 Tax=Anthostomella pinea TaxID=933095 RepID=A0AAI8VL39_9PEZI|nr:Uu.00g004550.m01.CDS01 [Anthostomella pinea]